MHPNGAAVTANFGATPFAKDYGNGVRLPPTGYNAGFYT
jgi:hypothetical protein